MDILRRFATDAPAADTFADNKPTLLMSWWCTCYAIAIILFRCFGRWLRTEKLFIEDTIMLLAIVLLVARMFLVQYILYYGTNNVITDGLTVLQIHRREIGSQLVMAARILYASYLWTIKLSASMFLVRLTAQFWTVKTENTAKSLNSLVNGMFYSLLAFTWVAVFITNLVECQPFTHYWQVVPDPGPQCRQGQIQLIAMGVCSVVTDVALIVFPIPMIWRAKIPNKKKYNLALLLAFPTLNIILSVYRLPTTFSTEHQGAQPYRSLLASLDILIATVTSNALVVTSFLQDKGFKKHKYKYRPEIEQDSYELGAVPDSRHDVKGATALGVRAREDMLKRRWGSDEDLMRDDDAPQYEQDMTPVASSVSFQISDRSRKSYERGGDPHHVGGNGAGVQGGIQVARGHISRPEEAHRSPFSTIFVETSWQVDVTNKQPSPLHPKPM